MKKHLRDALLPFILMALASILILVTVSTQGDVLLTSLVTSILLCIVSFLVATLATWLVVKDGLMRNDRFQMLNTHLAVALFIFAIGEVAIIALNQIGEHSLIILIAGIVQLMAVGLWAEGVVVYLISANRVLEFSKNEYVIPLLFIFIAAFFAIIQGVSFALSTQANPIGSPLAILIEIGLGIITVSMVILLWYYRGGYLAIPTLLTIIGTSLLLVRTLLWASQIVELVNPISQTLAGASYLLLGASLAFKSEKLAKVD